jgi:hypothetical protein
MVRGLTSESDANENQGHPDESQYKQGSHRTPSFYGFSLSVAFRYAISGYIYPGHRVKREVG